MIGLNVMAERISGFAQNRTKLTFETRVCDVSRLYMPRNIFLILTFSVTVNASPEPPSVVVSNLSHFCCDDFINI